jgi:hypothetical protein
MIASGQPPSPTLLLTWDNPTAFFYFPQHGIGPDVQDPSNIATPTPIERQVDDLLLHRGQAARIGIAADEGSATLGALLTAKPLFAVTCLPILHDHFTLTMRTLYRCLCH